MTDFALGANGGFLGASGFTTLNAGAEPAKPLRDSRPPSAIAPRLRPDLQKNSRRVTARVFSRRNENGFMSKSAQSKILLRIQIIQMLVLFEKLLRTLHVIENLRIVDLV